MGTARSDSLARDLLTPANAVTLTGALLSFAGAYRLNTSAGLALVIVGRICDILDGPLARRTHTSRFGAMLDATCDKLVALALLIASYHYRIVPIIFLVLIFAYHLTVTVLNVIIEHRGTAARVTQDSKRTMFLHISSLIFFVGAHLVQGLAHTVLYLLAVVVLAGSGWFAAKSIRGFAAQVRAIPQ